jgi:small GTP-binding protein
LPDNRNSSNCRDTGGSIRVPASFCGVVGIKPSYGCVSRYGLIDLSMSLDQIGPLAKNVSDAALLLDVIKGKDERDTTTFESKSIKSEKVSGLKFGVVSVDEVDHKIIDLINSTISKVNLNWDEKKVSLKYIDLAIQTYHPLVWTEFFSATRRMDGRRFGKKIEEGVSMDSNALEQERGITIYSKNTSVFYKDTKINIVDTPGHADFGSEVERVLRAIDSVLLVVDAQEGPMPQTRFVLKKSLEIGLKPIVVINKIDKPAADPKHAEEQVLELFLELGATDEQADFPIVYAIGRQGIAKLKLEDDSKDLTPLQQT